MQNFLLNPATGAWFVETPELLARGDLVPCDHRGAPIAKHTEVGDAPVPELRAVTPEPAAPAAMRATRRRAAKAEAAEAADAEPEQAAPAVETPLTPDEYAAAVEAALKAAE